MFTESDFDIFSIPGFEARMSRLRASITPKLKEIGGILTPRLQEATGQEFHPHVALHMRRTVNPPVETWVAFGRSARSYKPFVHTRFAVNGDGIKIVVFLEDEADDKPVFAGNLKRNASAASKILQGDPRIHSYDLRDSNDLPLPGDRITKKMLEEFAERLARIKGQHASFGIPFHRGNPILRDRESLLDAAMESMVTLLPFYRMGLAPRFRL